MNVMLELKDFLEDENLINFFLIKGYKPIIKDGWFYLSNSKTKTLEKMTVLNDMNNKQRIRFKGKNLAFSLNRNGEGNLYLDHLLIGDIDKEEFNFIMRHEIIEGTDIITIRLVDEKNIQHKYKIKNNSVNIQKVSIKDKFKKIKLNSASIKDYIKQSPGYKFEYFAFHKDNQKAKLNNNSIEHATNCTKEFIALEKSYIGITSYIGKIAPFFNDCINATYETVYYKSKDGNSEEIKIYSIKRKNNTNI